MIKLMIVDDEPLIRKGFTITIDWNSYGIEIVGDASNGKEALDKIKILKPDIVVSDIKMPIMDGISLAKEITKKYSYIKIVILSGYNDFIFAKQVLDTNVCDYLIKPVNVDELIDLIIRLKDTIIKENHKKELRNKKNNIIINYKEDIKSKIIKNILTKNYDNINTILEQCTLLNIDLNAISYSVFLINFNNTECHDNKNIQHEITNFLDNTLKQKNIIGLYTFIHSTSLACILINKKGVTNYAHEFYYELKNVLAKNNLNFIIGIGSSYNEISDINTSYEEAKSVIKNSFIKNAIIFYNSESSNSNKYKKIVKTAIQYVYDNYDKNISIIDISNYLLISPNYFSKIFKDETDKNFTEWLNELRIDKAKNLLEDSCLKIYEIAEKVGYNDYKYFSYNFKKFTGVSAKDYRDNAK